MIENLTSARPTVAALDTPSQQGVACPFCHTPHGSLTPETMQPGDNWVCARCGQHWSAGQLETVAAYAVWAAEHDAAAQTRPESPVRVAAAP
jgi:predicted CXXCH cytochrome family protein